MALIAHPRSTIAALRAGMRKDAGAARPEWAGRVRAAQAEWRGSLPRKPEKASGNPGPVGMPALIGAVERIFGEAA